MGKVIRKGTMRGWYMISWAVKHAIHKENSTSDVLPVFGSILKLSRSGRMNDGRIRELVEVVQGDLVRELK
jgi:hypothetical protein